MTEDLPRYDGRRRSLGPARLVEYSTHDLRAVLADGTVVRKFTDRKQSEGWVRGWNQYDRAVRGTRGG